MVRARRSPANAGGRGLLPHHRDDLRRSGLTDETIAACGFYSESDPAAVARLLNWARPATALGPCLVIPFVAADGSDAGYAQVKPDKPLTRKKAKKPARYESPRGVPFRAFLPPGTRRVLSDRAVSLIITEGAKKAAAADQHGFPSIALVGVDAWSLKRAPNAIGKKIGLRQLIPDLAAVVWRGRVVYILFDSDAAANRNVRRAEQALASVLRALGAIVIVVRLPAGSGRAKVGLDDFLLAHSADDLRGLLKAATPAPDVGRDFGERLFRNAAELDRLADLAVSDPAAYAAERAALRGRKVSLRELDRALQPRVTARREERRQGVLSRDDDRGGPYFVHNGVIHRRVYTRDGEGEQPLCNFDCRITAQSVQDDGAEVVRTLTLEGRQADGRPLPPVTVPASQFPGMGWVTEAWGNRAVVYAGQATRDHLRAGVQLLSGEVPERTVFAHTGWREAGGQWIYLHAGGAIGAGGPVPGAAVDLTGPLAGFRLPDPPAGAELASAVRASLGLADDNLAPDRVVLPLLAAVYRAALGPADFAVHLFGPTGAFKSELAALCQQHFGPGLDARHLPGNWMSTANALEGTLFAAKDALVVVDDFNPTGAADPVKLHAAADRVFRGLGNGAGRQRMTAELTVRAPRPPRALVLSTGEDVPRGHSCRARVLVLEVRPGDVSPSRLTACQQAAASGAYATSLAGFVRWLASQYTAVRSALPGERAAERDGLGFGVAHARTPTAAADLLLGLHYQVRFAVEVGAINAEEADDLLARGRRSILELADDQGEHLRAADPVDQFLRLTASALLSGQAHLSALSGGRPDHPDACGWRQDGGEWTARGHRLGWVSGEDVYLDPEAVFAEVQRTCKRRPRCAAPAGVAGTS